MAWETPKLNWVAADNPGAGDFNRIESNIASLLKIATGSITDGGTIPLLDGFTDAQCHCMVSIRMTGTLSNAIDGITCYVTNRVVTATKRSEDYVESISANYIIIGSKT
jgi:hypothetical protein